MEYHLLSDELLVSRLRSGDSGAFSEIYKRYWRALFVHGQRKIGSDEVLEELLQNVFMSCWERRKTAEIGNLGGYLFNALKYQIINCYRAQFQAQKYAESVFPGDEPWENSLDESTNFRDIQEIFDQVLGQLPEKTRRIFQLSRLEYKSTREISELLDIPERTVEYHITLSLRQLRRELRDFLPFWAALCLGLGF